MKLDFYIQAKQDLIEAVREFGFVPLFENSIPGFSVEEHVSPKVWFSDENEGVWEWKGPVIRESGCAYGKFFEKKAVFISAEWLPDFANYRRDGYDFDARYDEGLAQRRDKFLYDLIDANVEDVFLSDRLFSVNTRNSVCYGAAETLSFTGYTYSLDSGRLLTLPEVLNMSADDTKALVRKSVKLYAVNAAEETKSFVLAQKPQAFSFCIRADGGVYLLCDEYFSRTVRRTEKHFF